MTAMPQALLAARLAEEKKVLYSLQSAEAVVQLLLCLYRFSLKLG